MIQINHLDKAFGPQVIFDDISFTMSPGERLGIVGRNGSGKSTLIKIIQGAEHPDRGEVVVPRHYRCGYLAQHLQFSEDSILKEACRGLPAGEQDQEHRAEFVLAGLGFSKADLSRPPLSFSGGFQIRVELARVLLSEPNLLLLDEPTNYLDIVSVRWLERILREWPNELILISHDRNFMDQVVTHTLLIRRRKIRKLKGATAALYAQAAQEDEIYEQTRLNQEAKRREAEVFINRFRAKATKASVVQSRIKALERMGTLAELQIEETLDFRFREAPFPGKTVLEASELRFAYPPLAPETAPPDLIGGLSLQIRKGDRIGVIGKNGKGKSTLLRLLAGELAPGGGELKLSPNARVGFFGQTNILRLDPERTVESEIFSENETLSRTETRNICGTMMFGGESALKPIRVLSGGEKSRVLIGKLLARRTNLLLLDEPSNHLDQESVEVMVSSLKDYSGAILIVTHNEMILRALANRLVAFQGSKPEVFEGGYDYFLEKIGWEDEAGDRPSSSAGDRRPGGAESETRPGGAGRKERALIRQERARRLRPLEERIKILEETICALEKEVQEGESELIEASQSGDSAGIADLSRAVAGAKKRIEAGFQELEPLVSEYDRLREEFERKLQQLS